MAIAGFDLIAHVRTADTILDCIEVGTPWRLVKDNTQFACLQWLFECFLYALHVRTG